MFDKEKTWFWRCKRYCVNPTGMVIELFCAYRAIVDKLHFRRNRYHNVKHLKNTLFGIAYLNWKNHELGQQFFFSSLSPPAGFSSCAMPVSFSLKYLKFNKLKTKNIWTRYKINRVKGYIQMWLMIRKWKPFV